MVHRLPTLSAQPARPLPEIVSQPRFIVGLVCAVGSYALMSFVMTGAPLAMVGCGFSPDEATLGISWHVMAMFGPSFFTGRSDLIASATERIVAFGLILLIGCAIVALSGIALWQFWTALILLGLGWNFGFIGATAMVADTYHHCGKGQGPGLPRLRPVRRGRLRLADVGRGLQRLGLGHAQLGGFPVVGLCLCLALVVPHCAAPQAPQATVPRLTRNPSKSRTKP